MTEEYDLVIYSTETGKEPFSIWLASLTDKKTKSSVFLRLQALKGGLHELRIHHGPGLRVYFAKVGSKILLLLGGGNKSSQEKDIAKCNAFLEDYKETKHG